MLSFLYGEKQLLKKILNTLLCFLVCILLDSAASAKTYYVAVNGSDTNAGTLERPFATINKGTPLLAAGDILYIRGGTYNQTITVENSGTVGAFITVMGYPGETVVIDGQDVLPTGVWGALFAVTGNYAVVRDVTVKNSNWMGLVLKGHHDQAISVKSYGNKENGILVVGDYGRVENCEVWWNCKSNEYGKNERAGWASGLSAARHPQHALLRNNRVWNNWGEGLSTYEAEYTNMEDNVVYDNWSANVYLSDTKYSVLQRNLVYRTPDNPVKGTGASEAGITMGDENYNPPSSDNKIINNLVLGTNTCFYFWQGISGGGLINTLIAYNTFVGSYMDTNLKISDGSHSNTRIENNLIEQSNTLPIAAITLDNSGLSFSYNLWSKNPPSGASGTADVIDEPKLAKTGAIAPGELTPEWFKILAGSPARDRAKAISEVTEDFFGTARGKYPDIGACEFQQTDVTPPTPPIGIMILKK
jgi:hypothetical protein